MAWKRAALLGVASWAIPFAISFLVYVNGLSYAQQEGVLLHEMLHNITGLGDADIQGRLGLSSGPSVNIANKLQTGCFH